MADFLTLGVLRHVQGLASSREQIQSLAHELDHITKPPLARSTWGDALASAKAWGKSHAAITNQVRLAIIVHLLPALFLQEHGCGGERDETSQRTQRARASGRDGGTDRPDWVGSLHCFTTRASRQVLRFFRDRYGKTMSPELIEGQLRPLLQFYL